MFELTDEQHAVANASLDKGEMLKVNAYAGTGKTSALVAYADNAKQDSTIYLAFNKSVEMEAKQKFHPGVTVKTIHALAWAAEGCKFQRIGDLRYFDVMKRLKLDVYAATLVCRTLETWFNSAELEIGPEHAAADVLNRYKVDLSSDLVESAKIIWSDMCSQSKTGAAPIQMTHSGYLKLYQCSEPRIPQSTILLDEAQDTNPVSFDIVNRQCQFGTKVLIAGDSYQQIYSWRGATNAMASVSCPSLRLTRSWRFGKTIANTANAILHSFFGESTPLEGCGSRTGSPDGPYTLVCRTNSELFSKAASLAESGQVISIVGETGFSAYTASLRDVYYLYADQKHLIQGRSLTFFKTYDALKTFALERLDSELASKVGLVERFKSAIPRYIDTINRALTHRTKAQVTITTAHKAKGLEWDTVVLAEDFCPLFDEYSALVRTRCDVLSDASLCKNERDSLLKTAVNADEINLVYVAVTRARCNLVVNRDVRRLMDIMSGTAEKAETAKHAGKRGSLDRTLRRIEEKQFLDEYA